MHTVSATSKDHTIFLIQRKIISNVQAHFLGYVSIAFAVQTKCICWLKHQPLPLQRWSTLILKDLKIKRTFFLPYVRTVPEINRTDNIQKFLRFAVTFKKCFKFVMLINRAFREMNNNNHKNSYVYERIILNCWPECANHTPFQNKIVRIYTIFQILWNCTLI